MDERAGLRWRTSTASASTECVAVAFPGDRVLVRHSKRASGPVLEFTLSEWQAFLVGARGGEFEG